MMKVWLPIRGYALSGVTLAATACSALGQRPVTSLPSSQPTGNIAASASASEDAEKPVLEKETAPRTRVTWMGGMLTISAENSSLNSILREITRQTGMKVTGGVTDERVFGSYGPGTPETVLVSLLTGTGSNILLKEDRTGGPTELVLSARAGGATPPSPGSTASLDTEAGEDQAPPQKSFQRRPRPQPFRPPAGMSIPDPNYNRQAATDAQGAPDAQDEPQGEQPAPATEQPATDSAKTPQEIYDQLLKIQQQKASQTPK